MQRDEAERRQEEERLPGDPLQREGDEVIPLGRNAARASAYCSGRNDCSISQ